MWGRSDSNRQPISYEPTALTIELHPHQILLCRFRVVFLQIDLKHGECFDILVLAMANIF